MRNEQGKSSSELHAKLCFCTFFLRANDQSVCLLSNVLAFCLSPLSQRHELPKKGSHRSPRTWGLQALLCIPRFLPPSLIFSKPRLFLRYLEWNTVCSCSHSSSAMGECQLFLRVSLIHMCILFAVHHSWPCCNAGCFEQNSTTFS